MQRGEEQKYIIRWNLFINLGGESGEGGENIRQLWSRKLRIHENGKILRSISENREQN